MSKRNLIWLAIIVVVGLIFFLAISWVWGLIAAGVVLVISEIVERIHRQRRRAMREGAT